LVNTLYGLKTVLAELKTEQIVLKPRYGSLGKDVIVADRNNLPEKISKNTVVQEFINSSKGIQNITDDIHDLRIIITNGKIDHCHVRNPKKGSLIANVSLGGKKKFIPNELIPSSAIKIVKKVDKLLEKYYPRIYSIDFIFDKDHKPYIVECNSSPTIKRYAYGRYAKREFFDSMFKTMISGIKMKVKEEM